MDLTVFPRRPVFTFCLGSPSHERGTQRLSWQGLGWTEERSLLSPSSLTPTYLNYRFSTGNGFAERGRELFPRAHNRALVPRNT